MTPLSQYFANGTGEDFTPLLAMAARKAAVGRAPEGAGVNAAKVRPLKVLTKVPEPTARASHPAVAAPAFAAPVSPRLLTEPRVPLRELDAERAARVAERESHAAELAAAVETARAEGVEAGRAAAREEAETEMAERLAAARAVFESEHAHDLGETRSRWTVEQGDRLADLLILQMAILEETVKLSLGNVLRPLALDVRRRQTIDEMVGAVKTIALDGASYRIAATGPADLLAAIEAKLGEDAKLLTFAADEEKTDIRIDAESTVIESRLSSWRSALEEALS